MKQTKMMASGGMTKKGYAAGGMMKKGYAAGGMAMVEKDGKKVPAFAADGVGKMAKGGAVKAVPKKKK
jgi:leucyl-tRNA synthetase